MPINTNLKKVMVIGSGPIVIGQAAEFDYAGVQAVRALREENIEVVLVNSNPATIMTDTDVADKVYIEPLVSDFIEKIIAKERPQGLLATLGGQTGLNLAIELHDKGILEKYNVKLLGTSIDTIKKAEDRESFKKLMLEIGEPIPSSTIVSSIKEGIMFANEANYPLVVRPAFTLGGTGGGFAHNEEELKEILYQGLNFSPIHQVLLEKSVAGWKEIEYEVIRDANDTCITVCNMENFDPVGIHTGDSIVVAPSQTISDKEYHMLRSASLRIIRALKIEGGCNVQLALNPKTSEYVVIEVNPRVSRSSALASKAAGYPIAKVTTKIAIGFNLHEIKNQVTGKTVAAFEPVLDYVVVKIPKWAFDKFPYADRNLTTQMKATGEVMAIDRTFESALLKALICLEGQKQGLRKKSFDKMSADELIYKMKHPDDKRIYAIASAIRKKISIDKIHEVTKIDKWFLGKIKNIIDTEKRLVVEKFSSELLYDAEAMGFTDDEICMLSNQSAEIVDTVRRAHNMYPVYKMVDTCAGEFESSTPYYYSTYEKEDENIISKKEKVIVIGSGPVRIGQGIEFDYSCVHAIKAIKENGLESIIINNNPETVSTDFDISDKLYFEPLYLEDVYNVVRKEMPKGVIVQFGGQTALNLAPKLLKKGVQILGTSVESINVAEDRKRFEMLLSELQIKQPKGVAVTNLKEALEAANNIGYPVLLRPSYVTGGRAMKVVYNDKELSAYIEEAVSISPEYPVSVDEYIEGREFEIDAVCDGSDILIPGIMEHIERTGIHSGDSFCVYPSLSLSKDTINKVIEYSKKISKALQVKGLMNIQFISKKDDVYVIEVNPRASRTVPILSKVTGIPMIKIALNLLLGESLKEQGIKLGLHENKNIVAVKAPVFSFQKLKGVDAAICAEMKSTGEVLGIDTIYEKALIKAFMAANVPFNENKSVYVSIKDMDKNEGLECINKFIKAGFKIVASEKTGEHLTSNGIKCRIIPKYDNEALCKSIIEGDVGFIINTPNKGGNKETAGFKIRTAAVRYNIPLFTCLDTANAYIKAFNYYKKNKELDIKTVNEYSNSTLKS